LFAGLDFVAVGGDLVALTGPSGSGKSTLLSLLARWETPKRGEVVWDGIARVGWVFQNPHGSGRRTALDHVVLPLLGRGLSRRDADSAARGILDRFDLVSVASRPFSALSGGEAQRLMLARALAKAPDLLLVDEPTAQLDRTAAGTVNAVLANTATPETIVVVATHDSQTAAVCPTVVDLGRR
jgi:ABC-type lipoprotein export system ATPase subunit